MPGSRSSSSGGVGRLVDWWIGTAGSRGCEDERVAGAEQGRAVPIQGQLVGGATAARPVEPHRIQAHHLAQPAQPAVEQQPARIALGRADFGVPGDDQLFLGAGGGHVQQPPRLGLLHRRPGAERPAGSVTARASPSRRSEQHAPVGLDGHRRRLAAHAAGRVGDDDHRKFQPLGLVDGHQLDGSLGLGGRFALPRADVAQASARIPGTRPR